MGAPRPVSKRIVVEPVDERRDEGVLVAIGVYMVECGEFTENSFRLSNRKSSRPARLALPRNPAEWLF